MSKSKFYRILVEGATVDGRTVDRQWIEDMAATFDPATYPCNIDCEHIKGYSPEPPFNCYGQVTAVRAADVQLNIGGKPVTKRSLEGQIAPNAQLLAINGKGQKLYTSCEISTNFAGTGKAGLIGLAVTDNPASLGTEMLQFAAKASVNPLSARKQDPGNFISEATEFVLELEDEAVPAISDDAKGFFSAATAFFKNLTAGQQTQQPLTPPTPANDPAPANDNDARFAAVAAGMEAMTKGIEAMSGSYNTGLASVRADVTRLAALIENTDANPQKKRPPAAGTAQFATDC